MKTTSSNKINELAKKIIIATSIIKANLNCMGLMYEPKKPDSLIKSCILGLNFGYALLFFGENQI